HLILLLNYLTLTIARNEAIAHPKSGFAYLRSLRTSQWQIGDLIRHKKAPSAFTNGAKIFTIYCSINL
ncbi:hypothetical protein QWY89_06595, partial [Mucilaginibacter myungsuensis]|uniref:hypothetical protein n=1 Tax=Mucilaginibacter myungsuensis TaxID=649104 RepID=UPI0025B35307